MKKLIIIIITFLISGCDLFNTRVPEPPDTSKSNYQTAVRPEIVISNLENSFTDKDSKNYESCLSDSSVTGKQFSFSPSSEALSQFPALGGNWTINNESQYFSNLIVKVPDELPIALELSNSTLSIHGETATYVASYTLNVPFNDVTIPSYYQGELIFELITDNIVWSIYFWQDIKNSESPSWSELKGRLY